MLTMFYWSTHQKVMPHQTRKQKKANAFKMDSLDFTRILNSERWIIVYWAVGGGVS